MSKSVVQAKAEQKEFQVLFKALQKLLVQIESDSTLIPLFLQDKMELIVAIGKVEKFARGSYAMMESHIDDLEDKALRD